MDKLPKFQVAKMVLFLLLLIAIPFISKSLRPSYLYFFFNILIIALGVEAGFLNIFSRPRDENAVTGCEVVGSGEVLLLTRPLPRACYSFGPNEPTISLLRSKEDQKITLHHLQVAPATSQEVEGNRIFPPLTTSYLKEHTLSLEAVHDATTSSEAKVTNIPEKGKVQEMKPTEELAVEKASRVATRMQKVKHCSSKPSLFFIGSSEVDGGVNEKEDKEKEEKWEKAGELSKQELFAKAEIFIGNFYKQLKIQREESWQKIHGLYYRAS